MYELDKAAFGRFLAQLRREKGMTQKELAAPLYVSDKAVSKWERGQSVPDISLLVPLAEQLNATVAELLQGRRVEEERRFTREETEYVLLDLQFLGITDLLVLRGDKAKHESSFIPVGNGYHHAVELQEQINNFNKGIFVDGSEMKVTNTPFSYGVACYPEKHEEAPNMDTDIYWLKKKMEMGAEYAVTQLFYDNRKYFDFVERARQAGVTIPIIPGIKPFKKLSQLSIIPKTFKVDLPEELTQEVLKCNTDAEAQQVGIEWCVQQCKELIAHGVPSLHFYSVGATDSIREVAKQIY